uniref:peptidyl-tRNA hydrolase n=1 Tax=Chelonoidis abingdonii TaxID=106734 RepID=A0A8C0ITN9_CHEAB|nr:putative peptidyl-tRNA hydrolase PTRHD1 [Chelonoidis abingdonii]
MLYAAVIPIPYDKMVASALFSQHAVRDDSLQGGRDCTAFPACSAPLLPGGFPYAKMAAPGGSSARALVQYVVLRGDLQREPLSWPLGALVAQACHAALAVVHAHYGQADTGAYLAEGGSMRTVVLEALDEGALTTLAETLKQHNIDHKVWIEQPENIATCIALRPYPKEEVHQHLKKFKLLK